MITMPNMDKWIADLWADRTANQLAKGSVPDNIADVKAALARLNDTPPIYDQMIGERYGNPYTKPPWKADT